MSMFTKDTVLDLKDIVNLVGFSFIFNANISQESRFDSQYAEPIKIKSFSECIEYYGYEVTRFSMLSNSIRLAATPALPEDEYADLIAKEKDRVGLK